MIKQLKISPQRLAERPELELKVNEIIYQFNALMESLDEKEETALKCPDGCTEKPCRNAICECTCHQPTQGKEEKIIHDKCGKEYKTCLCMKNPEGERVTFIHKEEPKEKECVFEKHITEEPLSSDWCITHGNYRGNHSPYDFNPVPPRDWKGDRVELCYCGHPKERHNMAKTTMTYFVGDEMKKSVLDGWHPCLHCECKDYSNKK